ncbi:MAG: hypothetical protein QNJ72_05830 [Pleurocapsa sp. MO_226.B13]|nr:hypothetical protein [Pleurocapsa sp. MO_226.B13]
MAIFVSQNFNEPVYTQLTVKDMYRKEGEADFDETHYYQHPEQYESIFAPYTHTANIMLNGIYWEKQLAIFRGRCQLNNGFHPCSR